MPQATQRIRRRWTRNPDNGSQPPFAPYVEAAVLGANQVHDALCAPAVQHIGVFEVANSIIPARLVSGDFVLTIQTGNASLVVLGDLMGKGLSAAMWLTHVVDLIHRAGEGEQDVSRIMGRLNADMHRSRIGVPLTALFMARIENGSTRVTYSCGGCPAAVLLRADQSVLMLDRGGPILGALEGAAYEACTLDLNAGDMLMAVSDGIIEMHQGTKFELRPDRVVQHLRYSSGESAETTVKSLTARIRAHSPGFGDDLSVVAVKRVS